MLKGHLKEKKEESQEKRIQSIQGWYQAQAGVQPPQ
jgi:hypothetical protein